MSVDAGGGGGAKGGTEKVRSFVTFFLGMASLKIAFILKFEANDDDHCENPKRIPVLSCIWMDGPVKGGGDAKSQTQRILRLCCSLHCIAWIIFFKIQSGQD